MSSNMCCSSQGGEKIREQESKNEKRNTRETKERVGDEGGGRKGGMELLHSSSLPFGTSCSARRKRQQFGWTDGSNRTFYIQGILNIRNYVNNSRRRLLKIRISKNQVKIKRTDCKQKQQLKLLHLNVHKRQFMHVPDALDPSF